MASFVKYEVFSENLAEKQHNLDADVLRVPLTNTAPNVATHAVLADITEIAAGNGYTAGGIDTQNSTSRSGGTTSILSAADPVYTASGGSMATFRYVVLDNDTSTGDMLIGYWDYGSALTLLVGETFTIDIGASMFTIA